MEIYYTVPEESSAKPLGPYNVADVASMPSVIKVVVPVPAIVVIMPVDIVTLRIRLLLLSAMYTLPFKIEE